jgi:hypothetical protein
MTIRVVWAAVSELCSEVIGISCTPHRALILRSIVSASAAESQAL